MNYRIAADTSSNVYALEGVDFAYVPLKIVCEKEYVDTPALDVAQMVSELRATKHRSGTSCPNVQDWLDSFGDADRVFAIAITGSLSGSYSAALQAAEEYKETHPEAKVHVINSLSAGPELRVMAEKLVELIHAGLEFEEIVRQFEEYAKHTHLVFMLESLTNLARNGRVNPAVAKIAGVLGIRVIGKASDVGTLQDMYKVRGADKSLNTLFKLMLDEKYTGGKVRIAHCQNQEAADRLKQMVLARYPMADVRLEECGALCSYYAERGGLLVGFEDKAY